MTDPIPSWMSSDGKIHTDYLAHLKHDLTLWLSKISENEVGSRKIVAALDETTIDVFLDQVTAIREQMKNPAIFSVVRRESTPPQQQAQD